MRITIIGSGSKGNCYHVTDGKTSILLDAGVSVKRIQKDIGFNLSELSAVLLTHEHGDHSKAAKKICVHYGVSIYSHLDTLKKIGMDVPINKPVEPGETYTIGGTMRVIPFDVHHDAAHPIGFLIESIHDGQRLAFFTDTEYLDFFFTDVDAIIGECNYSEKLLDQSVRDGYVFPAVAKRIENSHFSVERFVRMLDAIKGKERLKSLILAHMSDGNGDEEYFKRVCADRVPGCMIVVAAQEGGQVVNI